MLEFIFGDFWKRVSCSSGVSSPIQAFCVILIKTDCDQRIWGVNVQNLICRLRFARFASDPLRGAKSGLTVGTKSSIALSDVVDGDRKLKLKSSKIF